MPERVGIRVNLVADVHRWMRRLELRRGLSKTMLTTAGLVALRVSDEGEQEAIIRWAKLLDEGAVSWADFEAACAKTAKQRDKALADLLERALDAGREERSGRRARRA